MSERRWKVIGLGHEKKPHSAFAIGDILSISRNDGSDSPFFTKDCPGWACYLDRLVEIDANGKTIRTYKDGDTLDGGTLVKEAAMEGLDGVSLEIPIRCHKNDGCNGCPLKDVACQENLAAEVQRLRDKLEKIDDVWKGAPERATGALVNWHDSEDFYIRTSKLYTRTPPKSPTRLAAERLWEKIKTSDADAVDAIAEALEEVRGQAK
jgi:hypothetical protein